MSVICEYKAPDLFARYDIDENPEAKYFGMHIHDQYEVYYLVSGEVNYLVEGHEYPLQPGMLMIMRPGESHAAKILKKKTYKRYYINFHATLLDEIDPEYKLLRAFTDRELGCENLYSGAEFENIFPLTLFEAMHKEVGDEYQKRLNVRIYLLLLLEEINRIFDKRENIGYQTMETLPERMVAYVNAHLTEELSVSSLADKFYLSTSQFSRVFKKATGASVWEYVIRKRLTMAKEAIRNGRCAKEASILCGFGDYSVFYRAYVKHFGCSPTEEKGT